MKKGHPDMDFQKEEFKTVPIWIHLLALDLKYWGDKFLYKLVVRIGKPLRLDQATLTKERLQYARIMIEVTMSQVFPGNIEFENEKRVIVRKAIVYEWKPIQCFKCHIIGYSVNECKKKQPLGVWKKWMPKKVVQQDEEGFLRVKGQLVTQQHKQVPVIVENTFEVLQGEKDLEAMVEHTIEMEEMRFMVTRGNHLPWMDNILSWNVRGLNSKKKQHDQVRNLLISHKIRLFSLLETKVKAHTLGEFHLSVCPGWCINTNNAWHDNG